MIFRQFLLDYRVWPVLNLVFGKLYLVQITRVGRFYTITCVPVPRPWLASKPLNHRRIITWSDSKVMCAGRESETYLPAMKLGNGKSFLYRWLSQSSPRYSLLYSQYKQEISHLKMIAPFNTIGFSVTSFDYTRGYLLVHISTDPHVIPFVVHIPTTEDFQCQAAFL